MKTIILDMFKSQQIERGFNVFCAEYVNDKILCEIREPDFIRSNLTGRPTPEPKNIMNNAMIVDHDNEFYVKNVDQMGNITFIKIRNSKELRKKYYL